MLHHSNNHFTQAVFTVNFPAKPELVGRPRLSSFTYQPGRYRMLQGSCFADVIGLSVPLETNYLRMYWIDLHQTSHMVFV